MSFDPIAQLKADAAAAEVPIAELLDAAGVARTTWARWEKDAFDPRASTIRKLHDALDARRQTKGSAA